MAPSQADLGLVDRLRGVSQPDERVLNVIILAKRPTHDGFYRPEDVISAHPVEVWFVRELHRLRNNASVSIPLIHGARRDVFVLLLDAEGAPFAFGAAPPRSASAERLDAAPGKLAIVEARVA